MLIIKRNYNSVINILPDSQIWGARKTHRTHIYIYSPLLNLNRFSLSLLASSRGAKRGSLDRIPGQPSIMPLLLRPSTGRAWKPQACAPSRRKSLISCCRLCRIAQVQFCRNSTSPGHYKMHSLQTEKLFTTKCPRYKMPSQETYMMFHSKHPLQDVWVQNINCYKVIHGHQSVSNEAYYYKTPRYVWLIIKESKEWPWKKHWAL